MGNETDEARPKVVPRLTDAMLDTPAEVERLEAGLRWLQATTTDEQTKDDISRLLRGKSLP